MQTQQTKNSFLGLKSYWNFHETGSWTEKNSVQASANCLLWAQCKLLCVFVCIMLRGIKKTWIGLDRINPYIPPNNKRLGIVFWGFTRSGPIQVDCQQPIMRDLFTR